MPILITKFVKVESGVAGAATLRSRELIGRILTTSEGVLPGTVAEFTSPDDVGTVFATNSPEYRFALKYFGFVSKNNGGARKLSFGRWAKSATAPVIRGGVGVFGETRLGQIKLGTRINLVISNGAGDSDAVAITLNLSAATSYDEVRAAIQTALRANANPQLAQANVLYTASTGQFTLQGGVTTPGSTISVVADANPAEDVGTLINWTAATGGASVRGYSAQTPLEAIIDSSGVSDNFATFGYIDSTISPRVPLTAEQTLAVSEWVHAQNVRFIFCALETQASAQRAFDDLRGLSCVAVGAAADDFAEFVPMIVGASINYDRPNASTNFMYQTFNDMIPTVDDTPESDRLDALRMNYVGRSMTAGQRFSFYQRGVLMGGPAAPVDTGTCFNEIWLKDDITTTYMNAFLALNRIPANLEGRALILTNLQTSVVKAVNNGVISVGKLLTSLQKQKITELSGDPDVWQQIQTAGYWSDAYIKEVVTVDGRTEYVGVFQLIYAKDDQIRKVEGTNTLI